MYLSTCQKRLNLVKKSAYRAPCFVFACCMKNIVYNKKSMNNITKTNYVDGHIDRNMLTTKLQGV